MSGKTGQEGRAQGMSTAMERRARKGVPGSKVQSTGD